MVEIVDLNTKEKWNFYVEPKLLKYAYKIKEVLDKKDKDHPILIDGYEGAGKSTLASQLGRVVDPTLTMDRICMTSNEFKDAIIDAKKGQCVIYDEAVTGLSSADSISKIGKLLKSMMMQMRQKNLFVIIVVPSFFELNRYAVLSRAKALFHVYEVKGLRGYWVGYNKKDMKMLYMKGKKYNTYCVRSFFKGRFYGKFAVDEDKYRKKKEEALFNVDLDEGTEYQRLIAQRNYLIKRTKKNEQLTIDEMVKLLNNSEYPLGKSQISRICTEKSGQVGNSPLPLPM